jgi:tetratricopeptide (TPR) repeat protein
MKGQKLLVSSLAVVSLFALVVLILNSVFKRPSPSSPKVVIDEVRLGPADKRILLAQQAIERAPNSSEAYNLLISAYMQKARESSDFSFYGKAEATLNRSLEIEPENYDAIKLKAKIQLTYHRFKEALETARRAQLLRADDHDVWGQITDALVELGDYRGAISAAQKMVDLRPDSSAYARISYLRSLHGDIEGAIQTMKMAVKAADPRDLEGVAWCRVQLGNELLNAGKLVEADREFEDALLTFPGYKPAVEAQARARLAAGNISGSFAIYQQQQTEKPTADVALALGDLLMYGGQPSEANKHYEMFESLERENVAVENSWRHMMNYWLDHDKHLDQALTLASREYEFRKDIFTCDTLAWAQFKNGRLDQARATIKEALRLGTRDTRINYHAGMIYKAMNMPNQATKHLELALAMSSSINVLQTKSAKETLDELKNKAERGSTSRRLFGD